MRSNAVAFALILAVSFAVFGANLGIIEGTVLGDGDSPVAGAKVQLLTRDGRPVDEHVTDAAGHFKFEQVPFGSYRIRAAGAAGGLSGRWNRQNSESQGEGASLP